MDFISHSARPLCHPIPHRPVMCHFDWPAANYPANRPAVIRIITVPNERMSSSLWLSVKRGHTSVPLIIQSQLSHSSYLRSSRTLSFFRRSHCPLYQAMHITRPIHQSISSSVRPSGNPISPSVRQSNQSVRLSIGASIGHIPSYSIQSHSSRLLYLVSHLSSLISLLSSLVS